MAITPEQFEGIKAVGQSIQTLTQKSSELLTLITEVRDYANPDSRFGDRVVWTDLVADYIDDFDTLRDEVQALAEGIVNPIP